MEQEKIDKRRRAIAQEIVATEETYVEALGVVFKRVIQPLRELAGTPDAILSLSEVVDVFANFEVIYNCHHKLLEALKERMTVWDTQPNMGDVFTTNTAFMKLYTHYINNFDTSIATLKMYKTNKEKFRNFVDEFDRGNSTIEDNKLRLQLEGFLIMPVQRIPRYVLLLRDLSKYTASTHTDYGHINAALGEMEQLAKSINFSKSQKDNKEKLQILQDLLSSSCPFNLLDEPNRVFIREGILTTIEGTRIGQDKPLLLVLFNDGLLVARDLHHKLKFKTWLPLTSAHVEILTLNGTVVKNSEDVSTNSMTSPPPLRHLKSSPQLIVPNQSKSPRSSRKFANGPGGSGVPSGSGGGAVSPQQPVGPPKKSFSQHSIDFDVLAHQKILVVKSPKGSYQFYAKTSNDADVWFQEISAAIENEMTGLVGQNQEKNVEANLKLLKNLLVFETNYADRLSILTREFIKPLEDSLKSRHPILNAEIFSAIFGPFSGEMAMQQQHIRNLSEKIKTWSKLSKVTDIYNMDWLLTYRIHVKSYKGQSEALTIVQQDPAFKNFEQAHTPPSDANNKPITLNDLLAHPLRNLSSCYVIFRQMVLHTKDADDAGVLKELISTIKQIYEEQQNSETTDANASSPEKKITEFKKFKKSLKFWKTKRHSLPVDISHKPSSISIR